MSRMSTVDTTTSAERGRAARKVAPRSGFGAWAPAPDRRDPIAILEEQATSRVPELVPIRYGRMAVSPFTFFRGAAAVMAADLAVLPTSGVTVQACGDAHLSNFGGFASPDRRLVFSLNDFDETLPGPWEWDVQRLMASVEIAAREIGATPRERAEIATSTALDYRIQMRRFATMPHLDVWYERLDVEGLIERMQAAALPDTQVRALRRTVTKSRRKTSDRALSRLTHVVDGRPRFISAPPLMVPVDELVHASATLEEAVMRRLMERYAATLPADVRRLFESYEYMHLARRVVGVGSVGTRAWVILLVERGTGAPLVLQAKEAQASVLEPFTAPPAYPEQGRRVVEGQRLLQSGGDIFLGWVRVEAPDGALRDFYVRQLWDWKTGADVSAMTPRTLKAYARACSWALARGHARSGDRLAIAAYLGSGDVFDRSMADFAGAYADQNEIDHRALVDAIAAGRIEAVEGI